MVNVGYGSYLGPIVIILEPLWTLSIYYIPTWTIWGCVVVTSKAFVDADVDFVYIIFSRRITRKFTNTCSRDLDNYRYNHSTNPVFISCSMLFSI